MQVFEFKGLAGLFLLVLSLLFTLALFVGLPALIVTAAWNAIVLESFSGPEMSILQGFLVWGILAIVLGLILKPQIQLGMRNGDWSGDFDDDPFSGFEPPQAKVDEKREWSKHWKAWREKFSEKNNQR